MTKASKMNQTRPNFRQTPTYFPTEQNGAITIPPKAIILRQNHLKSVFKLSTFFSLQNLQIEPNWPITIPPKATIILRQNNLNVSTKFQTVPKLSNLSQTGP